VLEALGKALGSLGSLWVRVGTPDLTSAPGGAAPSGTVGFIQDSLWWYMAGAAVLAVIVAGARMAWEQRAQPGRDLLRGLLTLAVVSGAGLAVIGLGVAAADQFSVWILDRSIEGTDFGQNVGAMVGLTQTLPTLGPLIVIIVGLVAIFASFVQIMLMVVRGGMLVILAGVFPLAASFTSTETGNAWFRKAVGWTVAFILYKPAAAIIYATAFRLTGTDVFGTDGLTSVLTGVVLMIVALVALPALLRFVTPLVAQTAGGGGGGGAMAAAALPTGAIPLSRATSSGGAGPIPQQSQSGPGPRGSDGAAGSNGRGSSPSGGSAAAGGPTGGAGGAPAGGAGGAASTAGAGSAAGGAAAGGAAAGGGAAVGAGAGSAGGPPGMAVGAAVGAAADGVRKAGQAAAKGAAESSGGSGEQEGPRGSS
ncbi:MAG: hypothetical protein ACRC35_13365, partial [Angustibacter sp.]